ncbi:hypothetical protein DESUT3_37320 [Desulfuromonas versatilis]|uniref:Uncharacterized protein n=1 Tax=Desulfuromonas versatilis TaxID=2802975 RepID=A0ABM8I146_9BACT|nr:hypothetical protein [Desulfuromonas versatilis]BCR06663.1 hypothetical protein DESUT3_37320 [Desulfuromonas versatilis]
MKKLFVALSALCLTPAGAALAASAAREDHSGIVVWVFLGICALIVVAQLVPAVMVLLGLVKGVAQRGEEAQQKGVD